MNILEVFDLKGAKKYPNIAAVEYCLCIGYATYTDNTCQFANDMFLQGRVFSPRLPIEELEAFCRANLSKYEAYHEKHESLIETFEHPPFEAFWEKAVEGES